MNVTVKFFARYREALGVDAVKVEGDFATVDDVRALLAQRDGAEVLSEQNLMCARNEDPVSYTHRRCRRIERCRSRWSPYH